MNLSWTDDEASVAAACVVAGVAMEKADVGQVLEKTRAVQVGDVPSTANNEAYASYS